MKWRVKYRKSQSDEYEKTGLMTKSNALTMQNYLIDKGYEAICYKDEDEQ